MGSRFDTLTPDAGEAETGAAAAELVAEAEARALCRETLLMLATNYRHAALAETGARARALLWAAETIRDDG